MTVTLEDKAAAALQTLSQQAQERGLPLDRYLQVLADNSERVLGPAPQSVRRLSQAEFAVWLDALAAIVPAEIPPLPEDFSRADIYDDHD
jgi:hypothetical protein